MGSARTAVALPSQSRSSDICIQLSSLCIRQRRQFQTSASLRDVPKFRKDGRATTTQFDSSTRTGTPANHNVIGRPVAKPSVPTTAAVAPTADVAAANARAKLKEQEQAAAAAAYKMGGLADNSLFADQRSMETSGPIPQTGIAGTALARPIETEQDALSLEARNPDNLAPVINPRPQARSRWQGRMVIREIRRRGRLTKEQQLTKTERTSLSKSHFFKTSMKKLAPLARQIAGKPIDEAILQMRFSKKKAAIDVRKHLIQARDEAIVARGMGLGLPLPGVNPPPATETDPEPSTRPDSAPPTSRITPGDPSITPPLPHQNPTKSYKAGYTPNPTDIYISQAWTNRGPYGREPDYRAFGRLYIMRPPHTGLSVLLKEEKTRTREKMEKEAKAIRRRMGKNMWTQLPDRKIQKPQGQYVLW